MKTKIDNIVLQDMESDHYIFHFEPGSLAEKEIDAIAKEQERCFSRICGVLGVTFSGKIAYYLLDSADKVGVLFGCDGPCNAFAVLGENKIYATYNENVKCIGCHEDVHLISSTINIPHSDFLVEGLAMFFDETWWGIKNEIWACYYKSASKDVSVRVLLEDRDFYQCDCMISYPIAGAFVKYLIHKYGIDCFIALYKYQGENFLTVFESIYEISITEIEKLFWEEIMRIDIDIQKIEDLLKDET